MELAASFVAAFLVMASVTTLIGRVRADQRRMERKLDRLLAQAGLPIEPAVSARVLELATTFRQAEAIKQYRAETGADLAEAKAAIDDAVANHRRRAESAAPPAATPEGPALGT